MSRRKKSQEESYETAEGFQIEDMEGNAVADDEWTPTGQPVVYRLTLENGQSRQVTLQSTLRAQLAAVGYSPRDVTHLALSHYHWDHTANANAFASAMWLVRPIEREAMFSGRDIGNVRTRLYAALKDSRTTLLEADEHDVFGDGTVIIKGDWRAIVIAATVQDGVVPSPKDKLSLGGRTGEIVAVSTSPGGSNHVCQVRGR